VTTAETEARDAILTHHRALAQDVAVRVAAVARAVERGEPHDVALAELVSYVAGEVLPHAMAEEHSLYRVASTRAELQETVHAMIGEHRTLTSMAERLANGGSAPEVAATAMALGDAFGAHVAKENDVLLPWLLADPEIDLAQLLVQMHRLTEAAQRASSDVEDMTTPDTESTLLGLLLDAAGVLARSGRADPACRLVAAAWAVLRQPRPDLAARTTAELHRLVRSVTSVPVSMGGAQQPVPDGADDPSLDVRELPPALRHEVIFTTYHALAPGMAFVLVNDHDPKPLRYQFEAEHGGEFTWEYLEQGPRVWRVRIGRALPTTT